MQRPYFHVLPVFVLALSLNACTAAESGANSGAAVSVKETSEGKSLQNPVAASPESIASGQGLYGRLCAECHGEKGDGVSEMAASLSAGELKPSDLTDDVWEHGSTDGEIFVFIRDGAVGSGAMKGLNGRPGVGPTEMWNLVNYIRSIHRE